MKSDFNFFVENCISTNKIDQKKVKNFFIDDFLEKGILYKIYFIKDEEFKNFKQDKKKIKDYILSKYIFIEGRFVFFFKSLKGLKNFIKTLDLNESLVGIVLSTKVKDYIDFGKYSGNNREIREKVIDYGIVISTEDKISSVEIAYYFDKENGWNFSELI